MNIYVHRFNNAIRALQESPAPHWFNMHTYGYDSNPDSPLDRDQNPCGTPACVLGHYGFRTDLQSAFQLDDGNLVTCNGRPVHYSEQMVADHFGITRSDAFLLFYQHGCGGAETPVQAIKYIRDFVALKWPAPSWNDLAMEPLPLGEVA